MSYRVYEYGLLPPTEGRSEVLEQMRRGRNYQSKLVAIERWRRLRVAAIEERDPIVAWLRTIWRGLKTQLGQEIETAKAANITARARLDHRAEVIESRAALDLCRTLLDVAVLIARHDRAAEVDAVTEQAGEARREARAKCGLFSATYQVIEAAADAAGLAALKESGGGDLALPRPVFGLQPGCDESEIDGRIAVGGTSTTPGDPFDPQCRHIRIEPDGNAPVGRSVNDATALAQPPLRWGRKRYATEAERIAAWQARPAADRLADRRPRARGDAAVRDNHRATLRFRVRSDPQTHRPIWATFPMVMHRTYPAGVKFKWGVVILRRVADREQWLLQLTADETNARRPAPPPPANGPHSVVGVDVGWRRRPEAELRVGYCVDDLGHEEEIRLPEVVLTGLRKADEIESIRDKLLDRAKALLAAGLVAGAVPPDIAAHCVQLGRWRSQARMTSLVKAWRRQGRPDRDAPLALWLLAWLRQDCHLWQWAAEMRTRVLRCRREEYRTVAARLAGQHATLVIEGERKRGDTVRGGNGASEKNMDLRPFCVEPLPEAPENKGDRCKRKQRVDGAPAELRSCLVQAFASRGRAVIKVPAPGTTIVCHLCGYVNVFARPEKLMQMCAGCGRTWDQDSNAGHNLIARAPGCSAGPPSPPAGKKPGRGERLRDAGQRRRTAPRAGNAATRNGAGNGARL